MPAGSRKCSWADDPSMRYGGSPERQTAHVPPLPTDLPDAARMKVQFLVRAWPAGRTAWSAFARPIRPASAPTTSTTPGARRSDVAVLGDPCPPAVGAGVSEAARHAGSVERTAPRADAVRRWRGRSRWSSSRRGLTPTCEDELGQPKSRLGRPGPPTQTIRWHTFGLDRELAAWQTDEQTELLAQLRLRWKRSSEPVCGLSRWPNEAASSAANVAPPTALRTQAVMVSRTAHRAWQLQHGSSLPR